MIRLVFLVLLPLLAPFIVYGLYLWLARRGQPAGSGDSRPPPGQEKQPWVWLLLAGVCLSAALLVFVGQQRGVAPGTKLLPPALVDGEVVPGRPADQ